MRGRKIHIVLTSKGCEGNPLPQTLAPLALQEPGSAYRARGESSATILSIEIHAATQWELDRLSLGTSVFMGTCIFCRIVEGVEPAHRVWETTDFLAFLTRSPCNPGHTLLIPKSHVDYVFDLEEPLYSALFQAAKQLSAPIQRATDAKRIGVAVEGFSVPHVHVHLVPLYYVSELDPHRHIEQSQQELAEMAGRIRSETPGTNPSTA